MSDDVINANPTIVDVADLPTRLNDDIGLSKKEPFLEDLSSLSFNKPTINLPVSDYGLTVPDLMSDSSDIDMSESDSNINDEDVEEIDSQEIFDLISSISDPEHPLTLAQLAVVNLPDIWVTEKENGLSEVLIKITPTITHCSLATLIGLGIRVRLERCLPPRFRIRILVKEGTHQSENQVNKQLNDKERVAAACENEQLLTVILQMLGSCK